VATATAGFILGDSVSFIVAGFTMGHPIELVFYLILGIILGFASVIWMRGFYYIEDLFERIRVSPYALPAIGGLLIGLLAIGTFYLESVFRYQGAVGVQPYYPAGALHLVLEDQVVFLHRLCILELLLEEHWD